MRRKIILGAVGATALTIGLGVGATLSANSDSTPPTSTGSITMMDGTDMTTMMGADGMAAMHTAMHDAPASSSTDVVPDHAAHHSDRQP